MQWSQDELKKGVEQCLAGFPAAFLVDAKLNLRRNTYLLVVRCESDTGITVDDLAEINRKLSAEFSLPGLDTDSLAIEVTSPGTGYAITTARHFKRYTGHGIRVRHQREDLQNPVDGVITAVTDELLELDANGEKVQLPLSTIVDGKVKLDW